jgi:hypothetical protein
MAPPHGAPRLAGGASRDNYDVERGTITELRTGGYGECFGTELAAQALDDPDQPTADEGFFYLVRGRDSGCGAGGSFGTDSTGATRHPACP